MFSKLRARTRSYGSPYSTKAIIARHQTTPVPLCRLSPKKLIKLRDYDSANAKAIQAGNKSGKFSYDVVLKNGLVHPLQGNVREAPNGMSLYAKGPQFEIILVDWNKKPGQKMLVIPAGTSIPSDLVLVHEFHDHYSLQVAKPMTLEDFNRALTKFIEPHPTLLIEDYLKNW